jgi:hypothetical protein
MTEKASPLPTDPFDQTIAKLIGHPDGAHTQPAVVQDVDFYGNVSSYMLQTVKWPEGVTQFVTVVNAAGSNRYMLPPRVLAVLDRQRESVSLQVRRRHGRRLAEASKAAGRVTSFTPEMRAKALATRKAKAAKRKARKARQ